MPDTIIEINGLKNFLSSKWVHKNVNLTIYHGETIAIIGGSGAGKSVLLKNICGLMKPTDGSIKVKGKEILNLSENDMDEIRKNMGYVFQGAALFDSLTILENVGFSLFRFSNYSREQIRSICEIKLEQVGLKGVLDLKPIDLSGGMQKRVGIARAIAMDPEIIFYDEPTTGIDPIMSDVLNELILQLQKELKVTSIVVTHDMKSAYKVADRIAMLYNGEIIGIGSPEEIQNTSDPFIKQFIYGISDGPLEFD